MRLPIRVSGRGRGMLASHGCRGIPVIMEMLPDVGDAPGSWRCSHTVGDGPQRPRDFFYGRMLGTYRTRLRTRKPPVSGLSRPTPSARAFTQSAYGMTRIWPIVQIITACHGS